MSHFIQAFVGKREDIKKIVAGFSNARYAKMKQGLAMIPLTEPLLDEMAKVVESVPAPDRASKLCRDPGVVFAILEKFSAEADMGYVETEYFGGTGGQFGALAQGGKVTAFYEREAEPGGATGEIWPINAILRHFGVSKNSAIDEFDAVELGNYRSNDALIKSAQR
jgi:hypothetical protein